MNKIKIRILYFYYVIVNFYQRMTIKSPMVKSTDQLIEKIIKDKASISRFGDGEFAVMENGGNGFQARDQKLRLRLLEIINFKDDNFLICIPDVFQSLSKYRFESKMFWLAYLTNGGRKTWTSFMDQNIYYDALVTRPYMMYKNKVESKFKFEKLKLIWENRDIIIVEGHWSRLGVGNDLFDSSKSIKRIVCPAKNAFDKYDCILNEVQKNNRDTLILIALGQTATVLAYDLYQLGFQAIDLGHVDIEYEWFIKGCTEKEKIKGKFVNEVSNGDNVSDEIIDNKYKEQIIAWI